MADPLPEPDRTEGAPHPRETARLFGHAHAEAEFLQSFQQSRLHHAWLITGPKGVGKATLAWRLARFLLATPDDDGGMFAAPPPDTLDIPDTHPVARRMAALAEPRLTLLRRTPNDKETALSQFITVDDVRKMKSFFTLSAADGGRRAAIVDAADEMNTAAANALLKLLEEPPAGVTFFLIAHQPHRLLPTIRSRCRELRLSPLLPAALSDALTQAGGDVEPDDRDALAELAQGSVGEAFRLTNLEGLAIYTALVRLLSDLPRLDRPRFLALADTAAGKAGADRFDLIVTLLDLFLARLARAAATRQTPPEAAKGEAVLFARLAPGPASALPWADLAQTLTLRARRGKAVNLDPAALLVDMLLRVEETAGRGRPQVGPMNTPVPPFELVDSHCHLDFPDFEGELDAVIARARAAGVTRMVSICTRRANLPRVQAIAEGHEGISFAFGIHPMSAAEEPLITVDELLSTARHPKMVGIGETGLDYHYTADSKEVQQVSLRLHIEAAQTSGLPLIIHARASR